MKKVEIIAIFDSSGNFVFGKKEHLNDFHCNCGGELKAKEKRIGNYGKGFLYKLVCNECDGYYIAVDEGLTIDST